MGNLRPKSEVDESEPDEEITNATTKVGTETIFLALIRARTPTEMDGALKGVFPKSETTRDIITKISAFLQLQKKCILTKFGGCSSKNRPAMPI